MSKPGTMKLMAGRRSSEKHITMGVDINKLIEVLGTIKPEDREDYLKKFSRSVRRTALRRL